VGFGGSHVHDLLWSAYGAGDGIRHFVAAIEDGWTGAIHAHEEVPTFDPKYTVNVPSAFIFAFAALRMLFTVFM
jgi:hypothetical protein